MTLHSLVTLDDKVITLYKFKKCTLSAIYDERKGRKEFVELREVFLGNDDDSILEKKIELQDTDHEGQTDAESVGDSSSDEDKDDSNITSGDIVWGMLDQWARKHAQLIPQQTAQTYSKVAWWK